MAEAANLLRLILLTRAFLKTADKQHQREHFDFVALRRLHARLRRTRQCGFGRREFSAAAELNREDENERENEIAQERVAEEHPARRSAVIGQADSERLDQSSQAFRVTGIGDPG